MRDRNDVETELHGAERALERDVAELKHHVDDAMARPREVVAAIEHAAERAAGVFAWLRAHKRPLAAIAVVAGVATVAGIAVWVAVRRRR